MTAASTIDPRDYLIVDSPYEIDRKRPLFQWILAVPHFIVLHVFQGLACVAFVFYWLGLLLTGRLNTGLYNVMTMYERYNARATGYLLGYTERFAPFDFHGGGADNDEYPPVVLELPAVPEDADRRDLLNVVKAIPHYLLFALFAVASLVVAIGGWFAVLATGRWPEGMRGFLVRVANYYHRIWTYVTMVEPTYPRFGLV